MVQAPPKPKPAQELDQAAVIAAIARAGESFSGWCREYVRIEEPYPGRGEIAWEPWAYLLELAEELPTLRRLVLLKARQLGLTWLLAAYALWRASYFPPSVVLLLSKAEDEAKAFLAKSRYIWERLPPLVRAPLTLPDNFSQMTCLGTGSSIHALPATAGAGRSITASLVIADELAFHQYAAENWSALQPTVDHGAQFVAISTANGIGNHFHTLVTDAQRGANKFAYRFLHALLRPGRDMAWYEGTRAEFVGDPPLFHQEYPLRELEAFILTAGVPVFQEAAIRRLIEGVRAPLWQEKLDRGVIDIYQEPIVGRRYVVGADVSYGYQTPDYACAQVLDYVTGYHVASLWGHFPPEELAEETVKLCRRYNDAYLGPEVNGVGVFFMRRLQELEYTARWQLYYSDWVEAAAKKRAPEKQGWNTGLTTRPLLVAELVEAVSTGALVTEHEPTIGSMRTFVHLNNKPQAAKGAHDDHVMALGIAWQMRMAPLVRRTVSTTQRPAYVGVSMG